MQALHGNAGTAPATVVEWAAARVRSLFLGNGKACGPNKIRESGDRPCTTTVRLRYGEVMQVTISSGR